MRMLSVQPVADIWRSGCAKGIDTVAAYLAVGIGAQLELFIPAAPHNMIMVDDLRNSAVVHNCLERTTAPASYRQRNKMLVGAKEALTDQLVAFVWQDAFYRSGEWMTINLSHKAGVEVMTFVIPQGGQKK